MRILVVEDEANLRDGIVDLLEGDDHVVIAVGDGVAGVETGLREPLLARAMGGKLTYKPRDGGGATFVLQLPPA